jgi:hypothetical protein
MPMSLSDLFNKSEGHSREANRASGRAAELEAELAAEREAQRTAEREAREAAKAAEAEQKRVGKGLTARVDALEKSLPGVRAAAARAADGAGIPAPDVRRASRLYRVGRLQSARELISPEQELSYSDAAASEWLGVSVVAAQVAELIHKQLGGQSSLYARIDAVESEAWRSFQDRVRWLAGE